MTDPTVPAARQPLYAALTAALPVIYDTDPVGLQIASDTVNEMAHQDEEAAWLNYVETAVGMQEAYIGLSAYVPQSDRLHHDHVDALRPLVMEVDAALVQAHRARAKQAHPAGKK